MIWGGNLILFWDCKELGDDVERIRIIWNRVFSYVYFIDMEDGDFEKYLEIFLDVC